MIKPIWQQAPVRAHPFRSPAYNAYIPHTWPPSVQGYNITWPASVQGYNIIFTDTEENVGWTGTANRLVLWRFPKIHECKNVCQTFLFIILIFHISISIYFVLISAMFHPRCSWRPTMKRPGCWCHSWWPRWLGHKKGQESDVMVHKKHHYAAFTMTLLCC